MRAPLTVGVRHVDAILKHGLDRLPLPEPPEALPLTPVHEHLRGGEYYQDPAALSPASPAAEGPSTEPFA